MYFLFIFIFIFICRRRHAMPPSLPAPADDYEITDVKVVAPIAMYESMRPAPSQDYENAYQVMNKT